MKRIREIRERVFKSAKQKTIAVAAAEDEDVLIALKETKEAGLALPVLIGEKKEIERVAAGIGFNLSGVLIIPEADPFQAARKAVGLVREGQADVVMKGLLGTAVFLKAIFEKESGLRTGNILSHVAVFEIPALERLMLISDCAMNIAPSLAEKVGILNNLLPVAAALEIQEPKAAAVCAVETVNPDMRATVDAALLAKMSERGQLGKITVEGPLAFDNAISLEAARHKGIKSPVAGKADIILAPNIEAGNVLYKALVHLLKVQNAGVVMGAAAPMTTPAFCTLSK